MNQIREEALRKLLTCPYPGRVIGMGLSPNGENIIAVTTITGRSPGSRNRRYTPLDNNAGVQTEYANPAQGGGDPRLIIYPTMQLSPDGRILVVSNGHQTTSCLKPDETLKECLAGWTYEPDVPNFTPRITARAMFANGSAKIHIASITRGDGGTRIYNEEEYELQEGAMIYTRTYVGDGDPLPPFVGFLEINFGENIGEELFGGLCPEHMVAVAVAKVPLNGGTATFELHNR